MDVPGQLEEVEQGRLGQTNLILKSGCLVFIVHLLWGRLAFMVRFIYLFICIDDHLKQWRQSFSRDSKVCLASIMFQYHSYSFLFFPLDSFSCTSNAEVSSYKSSAYIISCGKHCSLGHTVWKCLPLGWGEFFTCLMSRLTLLSTFCIRRHVVYREMFRLPFIFSCPR